MKKLILLSLLCIALPVAAFDEIIDVKSSFTVDETANRFEQILNDKGMTIFNRIKHSAEAKKVGIEIRETELILFGNPKAGSPLMKCQQSTGIDLPQKALIWKDTKTNVWISYNNPRYLEKRHNILGCEKALVKIEKVLRNMVGAAANK